MNLVEQVQERIVAQFEGDSSGHDWYHIQRVFNVARYIQNQEGGNLEVVELAALLHDISDHKFNGGKLDEGGKVAHALLIELGADLSMADQVRYIVDNVSYKGANTKHEMNSLEGRIVQDADRLDAIGAIGVGRTFAYGGHKGQPMYEPERDPSMHQTFEEYATAKSNTINHFYEKLLLLSKRLNTDTAKKLGQERHVFMQQFLDQFLHEWNFNTK
ncbi:MAG: HD domain-containing protein [Crocinitomicaceae bacterium]|nr:HD domain-containing protein [Crocinitomicaceae bacterium]